MPAIKDPKIIEIMAGIECVGRTARITCGQLDPKTYKKVDGVLQALGGKWNRGQRVHVFEGDARTALAGAITEGVYRDAAKDDGFFETPAAIADRLVELLDIRPGLRVLEPSAGCGALVRPIAASGGEIDCVEINPAYREALMQAGAASVQVGDFLGLPAAPRYDRVAMNPPFSVGKKQADIVHVLAAWEHLRPGGVLAAITASGWTFRDDRANRSFRDLVERCGHHEENPAGSFKEAGTGVNTVMLRIVKPGI